MKELSCYNPSSHYIQKEKHNMKIVEMKPSFVGREIVCEFTDVRNDSLMVVKNFLISGLLPHNIARVLRPFLMITGTSPANPALTSLDTSIGCVWLICLTAAAIIAVKHPVDQENVYRQFGLRVWSVIGVELACMCKTKCGAHTGNSRIDIKTLSHASRKAETGSDSHPTHSEMLPCSQHFRIIFVQVVQIWSTREVCSLSFGHRLASSGVKSWYKIANSGVQFFSTKKCVYELYEYVFYIYIYIHTYDVCISDVMYLGCHVRVMSTVWSGETVATNVKHVAPSWENNKWIWKVD